MRMKDMNTKAAILAPQTRLMLSRAQALTSDQGKDWLFDAGLRMVEYSIRLDVCNVGASRPWCPGSRAPTSVERVLR